VLLVVARLVGALVAAAAAMVAVDGMAVWEAGLLAVVVLAGIGLGDRRPSWSRLLPFVGRLARLGGPLAAVALAVALSLTGAAPHVPVGVAAGSALLGAVLWLLADAAIRRALADERVIRLAVIGGQRTVDSLQREVTLAGLKGYCVVGRVSPHGERFSTGEVPTLGALTELRSIVERHRIDELLFASDAPRMVVFEEVARSCLHLPVRLRELSSFYEDAFGHVPVAEINAAWFQYILHPRYRPEESLAARALDIVVAALLLVATLPLLAVFAVLIKRDGGPVFFRQERIGERGRPFTILKLRTMSPDAGSEWSRADDDRVTPIGRFLRRTHLDELPQVLNVLRGDMSLVGPRPEQPSFVDELEHVIPFYQRRHLIKPGITGWAQVRCGYAGSAVGSAWKVCHDLYYLKHRSVWFNLVILVETLRTLVADRQYTAEPASVDFILAPVEVPVPGASATA
jgi:exopolysaccharide biosynthesis polyprenyl glycosylphosphotransferase